MEDKFKRLREFQIEWQGRQLWVDVYTDYYRLTLPDGMEVRLWKDKEGDWRSYPQLTATGGFGRLIEEQESEKG